MPPPTATEGLLARFGNATCPTGRTFWFVAHSQAEAEAAIHLAEAVMARYPRLDLLFTAPQAATRTWLRGRLPRAVVLPPPFPLAFLGARFLVNLNVRGLIVLGALTAGDRALLRAANSRAIPAVIAQILQPGEQPVDSAEALGAVPERIEHHFVSSVAAQTRLAEAGVANERVTVLPGGADEQTAIIMPVLIRLLAQDLKLIRSKLRPIRRRMERLALRGMEVPGWRAILAFKVERIDTLSELRRTLGNPQTILCLGNGPSCEDPEVAEVRYDSLFRVNHLWQERGFLTQPDMVFTNSKETLSRVKGAIFGIHSIKSEARLLVTRLLQPRTGRVRYTTVERFGLYLSEQRWLGIRPTNGATMLATAVALQPVRLVVSGMDLFSHPAGTYPGDTETPNAYTPGHSAESELALLLEALSLYKGELVIISSALREQWMAFRDGPRGRQDAS